MLSAVSLKCSGHLFHDLWLCALWLWKVSHLSTHMHRLWNRENSNGVALCLRSIMSSISSGYHSSSSAVYSRSDQSHCMFLLNGY